MYSKRFWPMLALVAVLALVAAACGEEEEPSGPTAPTAPTGATATGPTATGPVEPCDTAAAGDLLERICSEGVIRVSTDPAYPPQSFLNSDTGEYEGFDIDVATEIANRLGVRVEWIAPDWGLIIAGGWNDRWDMSVGSMTVTPERAEVLDFAPAYYYTPAVVAVHEDNTTVADLTMDLDGMKIGVCGGCTYDYFLQKTLDIPGYTFDFIIDDAEILTYDTDSTAVQDLALGDGVRLDAAISSETVILGAIDKGKPIKVVGDPVFYEPLAVAFDRSAPLDDATLLQAVSGIIDEMHADGTLSDMSIQWFKTDYTIAT